jgi:hypothetical protein
MAIQLAPTNLDVSSGDMRKATLGWFTFIAALLSFGGAYLFPQARNFLVYLGIVLLVATSFLRPPRRVNKWGS